MLKWSEEFATGVKLVDLQHQRLIDHINALETLLGGPPPERAACDQLISFLVKYVNTHFQFEEICMERRRCPAHAQNQREHAALQSVVASFAQRYRAEGPTADLLHSLHRTTSEWIGHHILTVDIRLRGCAGADASPPARRLKSAAAEPVGASGESATV